MYEGFDGVTFNQGIIFILFIVLLLFGTFISTTAEEDDEEAQLAVAADA
ncbi:hypothetical protein [Salicibibacter halophilus]|nr:hypothetical protein [Salicibibacter halophilus]